MTQPTRPTRKDITTAELAMQLFERGPADVAGLHSVVEKAVHANDRAAEAIAQFALGNYLDGNVPGAEKVDHAAAVRHFARATELYPDWPEAIFNKGIAHIHNGEYVDAIAAFGKAEPLFLASVSQGGSAAAEKDRLLLGKLYLFRAEAFARRRQAGDVEAARNDLSQAQSMLLLSTPEARVWLEQIP